MSLIYIITYLYNKTSKHKGYTMQQHISFTQWLLSYADEYIRSLPLDYQYDLYQDYLDSTS